MSDLLSGAKDVLFGNEQKIAKPISDFNGLGFNAPGLGVNTYKGGFDLGRSPETQAALSGLSSSFSQASAELGALKPLVSPAYGNLSRIGSAAIEDNRRKTVGDLKQNLARRKIAGSSFAADDLSRTNAEFAKTDAQFRATTALQEIEATAELINQQYDAAGKGFAAVLEQGQFESAIGAELSRQYTGALAELAKFESALLRDEADGVTSAIGAGTTALLGGALGGFGASLLGGSGGAAGAAGAGVAGAAGFGLLGTQVGGLGTVGGLAQAGGAGLAGNLLARKLPGDQSNVPSNVGAVAGTAIGSIWGPAGAAAGGFIGTALGSAVNHVFGGNSGGGEDKADYSLAANASGTAYKSGLSADGVWGSVGLGHQKHINDTSSFQDMFDNVVSIDEQVSQMFTPEQNAAIKAEIEQGGIIAENSNEGGFSPGRAAKIIFEHRAKAIQKVLGADAFTQTGLDQLYAALASGDQAALESLFNQQQGTQEVAEPKYSIPNPVAGTTFIGG